LTKCRLFGSSTWEIFEQKHDQSQYSASGVLRARKSSVFAQLAAADDGYAGCCAADPYG